MCLKKSHLATEPTTDWERLDWMRGAVHSPCSCGRAGRPGAAQGRDGLQRTGKEGGREEAGRGGSLRGWAISEQEERKSPPPPNPRLATKRQAEWMPSTTGGQKTGKVAGAAGRSFG